MMCTLKTYMLRVTVQRRSCISAFVERVVTSFAYVEQMQQFFSSDFALALELDGLNESHPILQEVASPDEINSLFDSISYSKVSNMGLYVHRSILVDKFLQLRRCLRTIGWLDILTFLYFARNILLEYAY